MYRAEKLRAGGKKTKKNSCHKYAKGLNRERNIFLPKDKLLQDAKGLKREIFLPKENQFLQDAKGIKINENQ